MNFSISPTPLRIFLALSAPLPRARLRNILQDVDNIDIVGEASTGLQVAAFADSADADVYMILCDERILEDLEAGKFERLYAESPSRKFVLLTPNPSSAIQQSAVPLAAVLGLDASGSELKESLLSLATPVSSPAKEPPDQRKVAGMNSRFVLTTAPAAAEAVAVSQSFLPQTSDLTKPPLRTGPSGTSVDDGDARRSHSAERSLLAARLSAIQVHLKHQRDSVTGLANTTVLASVLRALPEIGHPAGVISMHILYVSADGPVEMPVDAAALRLVAAALRANLREDDVVCRLEGDSFAVVMPGLDEQTAGKPVQRIREALARLRGRKGPEGTSLEVTFGVGYWTPPMAAAHALDQAWKAMLAERKALRAP